MRGSIRLVMAKPRPKKRDNDAGGQLPSPASQQPAAPAPTRALPMQLKVGDRLADATGEWEVEDFDDLLEETLRRAARERSAGFTGTSSSTRLGGLSYRRFVSDVPILSRSVLLISSNN